MRRTSNIATASALFVAQTALFQVPQLLEQLMPFCILVGAMSCYLSLSRRLELVVARAAGISAWQFMTPALVAALILGAAATTVYNPVSAGMQERAKQMEAELFGDRQGLQ
ncbi:LPS export ABC transporter permease LptG, partial [Lactobacillus crispatus]